MKWILCVACLFAIALCAGCSTVNNAPPASAGTPNLVGNWTGPVKGYIEGVGFRESANVSMTLMITEQKDRLFTGNMIFPLQSGATRTEGFSGVINRDGKTFRIVEYTSGYSDGTIVSTDEIELIYLDDTEPTMLTIDILKRTP
ncbi:MAG: hypothetical protein WC593_14590 [Methanoregula sp.]